MVAFVRWQGFFEESKAVIQRVALLLPFSFLYRVQRSLYSLLVCCLLSYASYAAEVFPNLPFRFKESTQHQVSVAYAAETNLLVIPVYLNGKGPFNFLLDTGVATSTITNPRLKRQLGIHTAKEYSIAGVGPKTPLLAYRTQPVHVEFAGIEALNFSFTIVTEKALDFERLTGVPIDGILGFDLFQSFIVTVQPTRGTITFTDPTRSDLVKDNSWTSIPLALEDSKPYITADIAVTESIVLPLKLVVDTGAGHALSLELGSHPSLCLPKQRMRAYLGQGLSGSIRGFVGRVRSLQLGGYQLESLATSFPDASNNIAQRITIPRNGTLGFDVLRRFDIVIDYPHNQLMLRPTSWQLISAK
ncbi:aspartyl protease family protein [Hymenobacter sp. HD11105]